MSTTVSIIIPCYNQANYLPEALESVVKQSFTDWECIIVNDGSNDNTCPVARSLISKYTDKKIRLINQKNSGLANARNTGMKASTGKYMLPLDADDLLHPEMLHKTVSLLEQYREIAIAYTDVKYFGQSNKIVQSGEYDFQRLRAQNHLNYCSLYRKEAWIAVGGYNPNMAMGYEDWDFWIGCGEKGFYGRRIPEPLFLYRVKESSMYTNALRHHSELTARIVLNHPNLYSANIIAEAQSIVENCTHKQVPFSPLVSIIVPTYNRPNTLKRALESIAAQTYKNIEAIVVNDAGEDVAGIIDTFRNRLSVKYCVHDRNKGLASSRNTGINAAQGKYIAYLDDDDIFYDDHVETLVNFLENRGHKVAYTDAYRVHQEKDEGKYVTKRRDVPYSYDFNDDYILVSNFIPVLCVMHEKNCLNSTGLFDESLKVLEDWDLWIRMSRLFQFIHIRKITCEFTWRTDGTSMTSIKRAEFFNTLSIVYKKYREYSSGKPHVVKAQKEMTTNFWQKPTSKDNAEVYPPYTKEGNKRVSLIIPVFNKVKYTKKCIAALMKNTPRELYEIIIIDNASTDGTKDFLQCMEGNITIITNDRNRGFARACNQGARTASTDYLLFLNNDTEPKPGWLEPLLEILMRDDSVAAAGSKLLFPDETIQHAGVIITDNKSVNDPLSAIHIYAHEPADLPEANQQRTYQALTAACLLVRKSAFNDAGEFDEGYWNGYEDVDLCFKLQGKGWKLVYQPESVVIHHESTSGPERFSKLYENIRRLHDKWLGRIAPDIVIRETGLIEMNENKKIQRYYMPPVGKDGSSTNTPQKVVSVIILTWNALEYTKRCIRSIQDHTRYPHEIIFVDNASTDGTVEYLRKLMKAYPDYSLIENSENRGFAAANNQGVKTACGEFVMLLNNDVLVSDGWLEGLVESLERDEKIGMVGPITNSISGRQQVISIPYHDEEGFHKFAHQIRKTYRGRLTPRLRIAGFAVLIRKTLYNEVGGLNETFGTGNYEDDDLCLMVREKGYAIMVDESVFIHHFRSQTFRENKIDYRNTLSLNESKFREKWPTADYEQMLELHSSLIDTNTVLVTQGQQALESGNIEESIELYSKVLKTNPIDVTALCGIGIAYQRCGKINDALEAYKKATRLSGDDASLYNNLGVLYFKNALYKDARVCFEKALALEPDYKEAQENIKKIARASEKKAEN